ncbi:MAG: trans-sulfuration enzyme family protein [Phycisphaerae bacterium]
MRFATKAIHAAQPSEPGTGALVAPIFQTSTFEQAAPGVNQGFDYSRTNNPTRQRLEEVLAALEGVEHAAVYASGLAAENAILQALLEPGAEVIIPPDVYGGTHRLLSQVYVPKGYVVTPVDFGDLDALEQAISAKTRIVWVESPTNPRLLIYDIAAVCRIAHRHSALVVVDNTFASPVLQHPFELGADIVVHSVTKYLAGHSDLIQGAVLAKDAAVFEPIKFVQNAAGGVPSPFDCWLTLRGLKTLELRVLRHAENAAALARIAAEHPAAARVYYPGLPEHPGHEIAKRQMSGFGGMVSIELDGTVDDVRRFVSSRRYFTLGESLGGVKSLICHPATMTHASIPPDTRAELGLSDSLVRLSPGIEDPLDLVEDLIAGLDGLLALRSAGRSSETVEQLA